MLSRSDVRDGIWRRGEGSCSILVDRKIWNIWGIDEHRVVLLCSVHYFLVLSSRLYSTSTAPDFFHIGSVIRRVSGYRTCKVLIRAAAQCMFGGVDFYTVFLINCDSLLMLCLDFYAKKACVFNELCQNC